LPEYFFDLTGIHYSTKYTLTSETVKGFSRSMDGLMEPENPDNPYFVVEFQMQKDDTIYYRTVMEMAAIGIKNQHNTYYGIIIFADKTIDSVSEPWSSLFIKNSPALQVFYFDELLKSLKEKEAGHPLVAVFQPYLQKDQLILEKEAVDYYNQIQRCSISEDMKKSLSAVFISWMLIRFKDKSYQEVLKMLTLTTPLEETVAYKELVAIGRKEGEKTGEKKGKKNNQIEVALRMLKKGFELKTICELTGISLEEVQKEKLRMKL